MFRTVSSAPAWGGQSWPQPPFQAASAHACTRPAKLLRSGRQPGRYRVLLDVSSDPFHFGSGSNQMVVALILPEGAASPAQDPVGLIGREPLQGRQPSRRYYLGSHEKMHMVRHDDERMQLIARKPACAVAQGAYDQGGDIGPLKESGSTSGSVEEPVHSDESLAGSHCFRREHWLSGKTTVQAESHKQRLSHDVPVGQSPFIMPHRKLVWSGAITSRPKLGGRLKGGCGQNWPPHSGGTNLLFSNTVELTK
jgi:hypothetical protein